MRPVEVSELAGLELADAYDWYEAQQEGLGEDLLTEFRAVCERMQAIPSGYQVVEQIDDNEVRRAPLRRFPYGLFYEVRGETIIVTSFFHAKRDPHRRYQRRDG